MAATYDDRTLAFYDREAVAYASRRDATPSAYLTAFIERVGAGAKVLELGSGGGQDAEVMLTSGIDVEPTDGSRELAAQAIRRLGRTVRVMRFDELDAQEVYDGVWANACLLHVPVEALGGVLARVWRSLKPGGFLFASYKAGRGDGRDALGRYYNFPSRDELQTIYSTAGRWTESIIEEKDGGGYDGVARTWLLCSATKG